MRIQAIAQSNGVYQKKNLQKTQGKTNDNHPNFNNLVTLSFGGTNPNHTIFVGAEIKNLQQVGGVATVLFDYANIPGTDAAMVLPYYNGKLTYDTKGQYTGHVDVHRFPVGHEHAGKPFFTNADLSKTKLTEVYNDPGKYYLLDEIAVGKAPWDSSAKTGVYRLHDKGRIKGVNQDVFFIYTDSLAEMPKPYADGAYSSKTAQKSVDEAAKLDFKPTPYAEFGRVFVEFEDQIIRNTRTASGEVFSPMTISCSDAQTAYIPYYMRAKGIKDELPIYTLHNGGDGYTGQTSGKIMFQNLALALDEKTREQAINNLLDNKEYLLSAHNGQTDAYFKKFMPKLVDGSGAFNPTLIPFLYARKEDGYVKLVNTVSKGYAEGLAFNENIPSGIRKFWKSLYKEGSAVGILNPLNDPSLSAFEGADKGYLPGYESEFTIKYADGSSETIKPFRRFSESFFKDEAGNVKVNEETLKHVEEVKLDNQINFLKRLQGKFDAEGFDGEVQVKNKTIKGEKVRNLLINGLEGRDVELIGHISPEIIEKFEAAKAGNGVAPKVFVSWGRIDGQKALDNTMKAYERYLKVNPDAVLVLGGPPLVDNDGNVADCTKQIMDLATKMSEKEGIKGKMVFMPTFAPGKVLSGVADAAVFPSRFAPCELTDLESMKYFLRVIASNCQGLADKNFDARMDGAEKATGYKTIHEFFGITQDTIEKDDEISQLFFKGDKSEQLTGFNKLYADAEKEFLTKTGNSGYSYRESLTTNLSEELQTTLTQAAHKNAKAEIEKLKLSLDEQTKLKNLVIADAKDKELINKFAQNEKLNAKETTKLIEILNASSLEPAAKTRFTELANGTTHRNTEDSILRILFNKDNLQNKQIKLDGGALKDEDFSVLKQYLQNPTQTTRKVLDDRLLVTGMLDESQLDVAKRVFNFDPILNYLHDTAKYQTKYNTLIERCRNEIMEKEIFECMKLVAEESTEGRTQMLLNHYLMDTTWDGNAKLTGLTRDPHNTGAVPVSSKYLYGEGSARQRTAEQEKVGFQDFLQDLREKIKPNEKGSRNRSRNNVYAQAAEAAEDAAKTGGMSKGMKIALGVGAGLLALGGAYYAMRKSNSEKANAHGDTFKSSAPPTQQAALNNQYLTTK